jgi:hypothetical protein
MEGEDAVNAAHRNMLEHRALDGVLIAGWVH